MVREFRFLIKKQALVVFLVVILAAGAFLGTPARAQTIAGGPPLAGAPGSGDGWSQVSTSPSPTPTASPTPSPSASPTPSLSFSDVPADYWAYTEIMSLVGAGVVNGYPDGTFQPEGAVFRCEFAKMALLSLGYAQEFPENPSFPDVAKEEWYYGYVEGAVKHNLVKGYPDGTFKPRGIYITLAEILTVVVRAKGWAEVAPPGPPPFILLQDNYGSVRAITAADWYYKTVGAAAQHGLLLFPDYAQIMTAGGSSGEYLLFFNQGVTRAQAAVFLARMRGAP